MRSLSVNFFILSAIILTLVALTLPQYLPARKLTIVPNANFHHFIYIEQSDDGETIQRWVDKANNAWQCEVISPNSYLVCSSYFNIGRNSLKDGIDLSRFSKMHMNIQYRGSSNKFIVYLRNYNPAYSNEEDSNSTKFHFSVLRKKDFNKSLTINLSEFKVADWWIDTHEMPREMSRTELTNVSILGFQFEEGLAPGKHDISIQSIYFTGSWIEKESLYLAVLSAWLLGAFGFSVFRMVLLHRRQTLAKRQIDELETSNTRLRDEKNKFEYLSERDALTNTFNRQGIEKIIGGLVQDSRVQGFGVILMDIDHFKSINDTYGHDKGDEVLIEFAQLIMQNTRSDDSFARWGGEEFILICPNLSDLKTLKIAEKLRKMLEQHDFNGALKVTGSFGVGHYKAGGFSFDELFKRVDTALYQAKHEGRNRVISVEHKLE